MPSLDESRRSSFHGLAIPECPRCRQVHRVLEVHPHADPPRIQYWRCEGCDCLWVTMDGRAL
jgi:transposase-like protein